MAGMKHFSHEKIIALSLLRGCCSLSLTDLKLPGVLQQDQPEASFSLAILTHFLNLVGLSSRAEVKMRVAEYDGGVAGIFLWQDVNC